MEMKCRKEVRGILLGLCMLFLVIGCRNAITEEESAAPQEIEGGAIVNEENGEKEDGDVLVGDYEYCFLEDESAKILKYTGNAPVVFLPEKLEGKKVSVIGESPLFFILLISESAPSSSLALPPLNTNSPLLSSSHTSYHRISGNRQ